MHDLGVNWYLIATKKPKKKAQCINIPLCSSVHSILIRPQQLFHTLACTHTHTLTSSFLTKWKTLCTVSVTLRTYYSVCSAPLESYVRTAAVCTASKLAACPRGFQQSCSCVYTHMQVCIHAKCTHFLTFNTAYQRVTSDLLLTKCNFFTHFTVMVTESLFWGYPDNVS